MAFDTIYMLLCALNPSTFRIRPIDRIFQTRYFNPARCMNTGVFIVFPFGEGDGHETTGFGLDHHQINRSTIVFWLFGIICGLTIIDWKGLVMIICVKQAAFSDFS